MRSLSFTAWLMMAGGVVLAQPPAQPTQSKQPPATLVELLQQPAATIGFEPFSDAEVSGQDYRYWVSGEYMLLWVKNGPQPLPLVTTRGTPPADFGVPGTSIVYGPSHFDFGLLSGGRLTLGAWLDDQQTLGVEFRGFMTEQKDGTGFHVSNVGTQNIAVPFFDLATNTESSFLTNSLTRQGSVDIASGIRLWGAEANALFSGIVSGRNRLDWIAGFRYLAVDEFESITLARTSTGVVPFVGNLIGNGAAIASNDRFQTQNQFFGGQIGARLSWIFNNLTLRGDFKMALDETYSSVSVQGSSFLFRPNQPTAAANGGLFAGPSRLGTFTGDTFSIVPELDLRAGYNLTQNITTFVGYNFTYWSNVARPGNHVNRNIDTREIATSFNYNSNVAVAPQGTALNFTDLWVQSVNFGVEVRY